MERDPREGRGWPEEDASASGGDPSRSADEVAGSDADAMSGAHPGDTQPYAAPAAGQDSPYATVADPTPDDSAPAEIESWPSQDAADPRPAGTAWSTQPAGAQGLEAWPTEPPAAGSASADSWPTAPPERGRDAVLEPTASAPEPPPSEVEAYPAGRPASDESPLAGRASAHSVPAVESATGESTQCPRCGTENRPGLAFCRNCGQRLVAAGVAATVERPGTPEGTQACPRCGTHNRAGVAFCQNCGANLRGTAASYVPPAVAREDPDAPVVVERQRAILGPVVLLIGMIGIVTAYLLPFAYGPGSLFERAFGASGYGPAFWNGYPDVGAGLADQAYFGLAAPAPLLALLLVALAVAGFARAVPGTLQRIGLGIALLWSLGLVILFLVAELAGNWDGDLVGLLRVLTPAGIIFFLSSLIVIIGVLTRFGRS